MAPRRGCAAPGPRCPAPVFLKWRIYGAWPRGGRSAHRRFFSSDANVAMGRAGPASLTATKCGICDAGPRGAATENVAPVCGPRAFRPQRRRSAEMCGPRTSVFTGIPVLYNRSYDLIRREPELSEKTPLDRSRPDRSRDLNPGAVNLLWPLHNH